MRRLKQRLTAGLALLALLLCGVCVAADEEASEMTDVIEVDGGALIYTVTDGIGAITGFQGEPTDVTVPATVAGYPVQAIAEKAFYECDSLTSVTVPGGVKLIGSSAFYACRSLETVTLPDTVGVISPYAFYYCDKLTGVTLPDGLSAVSDYAFYACLSLQTLTLPDSVTAIGDYGLYACKSLTGLSLPTGLTSIGHYALYDCAGLTELVLPDSLQTVGDYAFYNCTGLSSFTIPKNVTAFGAGALLACDSIGAIEVAPGNTAYVSKDGILFSADGTRLLAYPEGRGGARYTVPDGVTEIGAEAFSRCAKLTEIILPRGLTALGDYAFSECAGLTGITLPDTLETVGNDTFYACTGLTGVSLPDSVTSLGEEAFFDCTALSQVTLSASLTEIGRFAFSGCSALTGITLPKAVETVGDAAFVGCRRLTAIEVEPGNAAYTSVDGVLFSADKTALYAYPGGKADNLYTAPETVKTIAPYAMAGASAPEEIRLPEGLTEIGERAFGYDVNVKSITLPASLSSVGAGAFGWCDALTAIEVANGNKNFTSQDGVLYSADQTILYAYPAGRPDAAYTVADTVDSIESAAFAGATNLSSVTLQNAASDIGADAFDACSKEFTLFGALGSTAAMYASRYGLNFAEIGTTPSASPSATVPAAHSPDKTDTADRPSAFVWGGIGIAVLLIAAIAAALILRRRLVS